MRSRRIKNRQPGKILKLILAFSLLALSQAPERASAQDGSNSEAGQQITDTKGGLFMEEVIDPAEERRKEAERKRIRGIDRHLLSPEELKNVGVQIAPSGAIVPLINRDPYAPPIRRNRSVLTSETQPAWTMIPYAPNQVYPQRFPYPYSGSGFYGVGSRTTITYGDSPSPQVSQTFTMPPFPTGLPFYNRFNPGFGGLYGGIRAGNTFTNLFLPSQSTYSLETTTRPLSGPISHFDTDFDDDP